MSKYGRGSGYMLETLGARSEHIQNKLHQKMQKKFQNLEWYSFRWKRNIFNMDSLPSLKKKWQERKACFWLTLNSGTA